MCLELTHSCLIFIGEDLQSAWANSEARQGLYIQLDPLEPGTEFCFGEMTVRWLKERSRTNLPPSYLCVKPHYTIVLFILRLKTAGVHHSSKHCVLTARHNEKQHGNSYCLYAVVPSLSRPVLWNPSPLSWKHCTKLLFHTSHEIKNKFIEPEVYLKIRRLSML